MFVLSARFRPSRTDGGEGAVVYTVREGMARKEFTSAVRGRGPAVFSDYGGQIAFDLKTICCVIEDLVRSGVDFNLDDIVERGAVAVLDCNPYRERIASLGDGFCGVAGVVRISRRFVSRGVSSAVGCHDIGLLDYLDVLSGRFAAEGRRMARSFASLRRSLSEYMSGVDVRVADVDAGFVIGYRDFLSVRVSDSTCGFYLRTLRSALGHAVEDDVADIRICWRDVCTVGSAVASKSLGDRVLDRKVLRDIGELDLSAEPLLELVRDMFMFSVYGHGIELSDLANLKKENLMGERLCYHRRQVGKAVEVMLGDKSADIIRKYADADSPYLLPILRRGSRCYVYETVKSSFYKSLRTIGERLVPGIKLSFSMARPSWEHLMQGANLAEVLI